MGKVPDNCDLNFRLAKYIASYIIVPLNGKVDALVFTGGIGENSFIKVIMIIS